MVECVILWRTRSGAVEYICKQEGNHDQLRVFANLDEAIKFAQANTILQQEPYQIVELSDL